MKSERLFPPECFYQNEVLLLQKIFQEYPELVIVYDIDGILADSMKKVFKRFAAKTGIVVVGHTIDCWEVLTHISKRLGLSEEVISTAEDDWFDPEVLLQAPAHPSARKLVDLTINHFGEENNFVLTARKPNLRDSTIKWFEREIPRILSNFILIREAGLEITGSEYKVNKLKELGENHPYVIFIEDSTRYIRAVLEEGPENLLAINVPLGHMKPNFSHERMIVVERNPVETQDIKPVYQLFKQALEGIS